MVWRNLGVLTLLGLTGCASIFTGSDDPVVIESRPSGAETVVRNEDDEVVAKGVTPMTVELDRGDAYFDGEEYTIECTSGGRTGTAVVTTSIEPWYFGNVIFGGLLGFVIIDPATGAMWEFDDNHVVVQIEPERGL